MRQSSLKDHWPPCWINPERKDTVNLANRKACDERCYDASDLLESPCSKTLVSRIPPVAAPHGGTHAAAGPTRPRQFPGLSS